jgi:transposase
MRGQLDPQSSMFHYFSPESRVPADHPLRRVKKLADRALSAISAELDALYSNVGRPSIAPERLLKGQLLIALYSIRSDRQFCEQLDYNLLFRWFLDMDLESASLDQSNFSRLRERLVVTDIARRFFDEVGGLARQQKLLSSEHFTVDGTLIDAWASFKSFKRKDGAPPKGGGDGTGMVDVKGEKRSNATHQSTTDPDSRLMRKGNGQPDNRDFYRARFLYRLSHGGEAVETALTAFAKALGRRAELQTVALEDIASRLKTLLALADAPRPDAAKLHETLAIWYAYSKASLTTPRLSWLAWRAASSCSRPTALTNAAAARNRIVVPRARWLTAIGDTMVTLSGCLTKAHFADADTVTSLKRYQTKAHQDTFPIPSAIPSKFVRLLGASAWPG